jgi:rhodanese-related sulfurtransferase
MSAADDRMQADHDEMYSRYGLPAFAADWVTDRVLAGPTCMSALDIHRLVHDHGVTHILDLREPDEWCNPALGQDAVDAIATHDVVRLNVCVRDGSPPTLEQLDEAVSFISNAAADPNSRVFVHCRGGQERTATVLVAWYAREHRMDYDSALEELRTRRRVLRPTRGQEAVARDWIATRCDSSR